MPKTKKRQAEKRRSSRDDASLYPLDPETAIRAIMDAGPHPKSESKKRDKLKRSN
jgi:hypothetical protein